MASKSIVTAVHDAWLMKCSQLSITDVSAMQQSCAVVPGAECSASAPWLCVDVQPWMFANGGT